MNIALIVLSLISIWFLALWLNERRIRAADLDRWNSTVKEYEEKIDKIEAQRIDANEEKGRLYMESIQLKCDYVMPDFFMDHCKTISKQFCDMQNQWLDKNVECERLRMEVRGLRKKLDTPKDVGTLCQS